MATDLNVQIKINNQNVVSQNTPVRVVGGVTVFSWEFDGISLVDVDETDGTFDLESIGGQIAVEIKIADNNINLGSESFNGNVASIEFTSWTARSWKYVGPFLERGQTYYGQIRLIDEASRTSTPVAFSFLVNTLSAASSAVVSPSSPTVDDDIVLTYDYSDPDADIEGDTLVRWFRNGVYQRNLDGQLLIGSSYMQIDDIWYADVLPHDGYEYGSRISSNSVQVIRTLISISSAAISPTSPNENDILKADYKVDILSIQEDISIRWFVNNVIQESFIDKQYMRYDATPGDIVRYEVKTESGTIFISSDDVTIVASDFSVYDIKVDGMLESLEVSTTTPSVRWKTHIPEGRDINYTRIQIGTFYEAENIYNNVIEIDKDNFTVPANILKRGVDYYISITISDTTSFGQSSTSHFRVKGSRWSDSVDNDTGWSIETIYLIQDSGDFSSSEYQVFRISDGTFFAEVRLHNNKIAFVSEDFTYVDIDSSDRNLLTIVGKGNDVKIYLDRTLVLDATGKFTQRTTEKILELGNITGSTFFFTYKYIYYTISGDYHPGESSEYSNMQFSTFLQLENNEIVALKGYIEVVDGITTDTKVFASNPDDEDESGSVYSILSSNKYKVGTVPKTYSPINKIRKSPDGKKVGIAHAKGASVVTGYLINPFNFEIDFTEEDSDGEFPLPEDNGWELVQNMGWTASYFNNDGFNINTIIQRD
jgi:hypothetical protein